MSVAGRCMAASTASGMLVGPGMARNSRPLATLIGADLICRPSIRLPGANVKLCNIDPPPAPSIPCACPRVERIENVRWERTITVIGCHVGGEDNHVIVGGVLPPPGITMFDKKRYLETQGDELRRWLLHEPRGKPSLCVNLVTPPTRPDCDAGLIIMESTDYPPMSGSNTICTVTVLLETGMLPMREPVTRLTLDTPAGPVPVEARCRDGKVERVQFTNVPCFATHLGAKLDVEGVGTISVDVAYGGAFFAIVDAPSLGFAVEPKEARELVAVGNRIVAAAKQQLEVRHPENADIQGVTFAEFAMPF